MLDLTGVTAGGPQLVSLRRRHIFPVRIVSTVPLDIWRVTLPDGQYEKVLKLEDFLASHAQEQNAITLSFDGLGTIPFTAITRANLSLLRRATARGKHGLIVCCPDFEREALASAFLAAIEHLEAAQGQGVHEASVGEKVAIGKCVLEITESNEDSVLFKAKDGSRGFLRSHYRLPLVHTASPNSGLSDTRKRYLQQCDNEYSSIGGRVRKLLDSCGSAVPAIGYVTSPSQYLNIAPTKILSGKIKIDETDYHLSQVLPISYISPKGAIKNGFDWPFNTPPSILVGPRIEGVGSARPLLSSLDSTDSLDFVSINIPSSEILDTALISDIRDLIDAGIAVLGFCDRWTLDRLNCLKDLGFLLFDWDNCREALIAGNCTLSRIQRNRFIGHSEKTVPVDDGNTGIASAKHMLYDKLSRIGMNDDEAILAKRELLRSLGEAIRMTEMPNEKLYREQQAIIEESLEIIAQSRSLSQDEFNELRGACQTLQSIYKPGNPLPKEDKIYELISGLLESSLPVTLVVDKDRTKQALNYWREVLKNDGTPSQQFNVISITDFMAERGIRGDETVVFCGWYDRGTMDRAIHSGIASDIILVLYSSENDGLELEWWKGAKSRWRKASAECAVETDRTLEALGIEKVNQPLDSSWPISTPKKRSFAPEAEESPSMMLIALEKERLNKDLARTGEKSVSAIPVVFDDGSHIWVRASKEGSNKGKLVVVTDCLMGASDSPTMKNASSLLSGDIVLRTHSDRSYIRETSQSRLDGYQESLGVARSWFGPIMRARKRGLPDSEIISSIVSKLHGTKSYQTVRGWVTGERIAPRKEDDVKAIFASLGEPIDDSTAKEIVNAAKRIRSQHQKSGILAKEEMVTLFLEDVGKYGVDNALDGFDERHKSGKIELLRVATVGERMNIAIDRVPLV